MQLTHPVGIPAAWITIIYVVAISKMTWVLSKYNRCTQELEYKKTDRHMVKTV